MSEVKVVLVNKKSDREEDPKSEKEMQIQDIKVTHNLIN